MSTLYQQRLKYKPQLPTIFKDMTKIFTNFGEKTTAIANTDTISTMFPNNFGQPIVHFGVGEQQSYSPLRIGVVLSGGQAPGGHNVISGIYDSLQKLHPDSKLFGFLNGPSGIIENKSIELTADIIDNYRNQGGFDMIGSDRTKIETLKQFESAEKTIDSLKLNGLVIIGGDDSNTNAALLAEYLKERKHPASIIGVPKTIDGDLKNEYIEISFGCDTACKVYSELIGNIARDAFSAKKYYHFIKLMGRSASHICLECALQTHPNITILGEEVAKKEKTLSEITNEICDVICARADKGQTFGTVLIPEGLLEFIPEFKHLINELNILLAKDSIHSQKMDKLLPHEKIPYIYQNLEDASKKRFEAIPEKIQLQLLMDRDPHGNVRVSQIETEELLIMAVLKELKKRRAQNKFNSKFRAQGHFMGYEGRSGYPSNFDCQYCYALGHMATALVSQKLTGYICSFQRLHESVNEWQATAVPLTMMMDIEQRDGISRPVIRKTLVDLEGAAFQEFSRQRDQWALNNDYRYPGPIQFFGDCPCVNETTITLTTEAQSKRVCVGCS
jgi:pyrophosphate--fructose-6-phosphate 1-phosphotransferase